MCTRILLTLILLIFAPASQAVSPMIPPSVVHNTNNQSMDKVSKMYYFTFASTTNPTSVIGTSAVCPKGSTFVNSSVIQVPSVPTFSGMLPSSFTNGAYMWQCAVLINYWNPQGGGSPVMDSSSLDSGLTNVEASFNQNNWENYSNMSNTYYTAYQYNNNSYVPLGVGGSGLGCLSAGGRSNVTCKSGSITVSPESTSSGQWLYYVQPGESLMCTIHRDYGSVSPCSGAGCPCDGTYTITPGQALVGACCNGTWKTTTTGFSNSAFTTCNFGC